MRSIRLAEARAGGPSTTHFYDVAWRSPHVDGRMGAYHALERPSLFDTLGTTSGERSPARAFA